LKHSGSSPTSTHHPELTAHHLTDFSRKTL
jgi:hypothetical protein